MPARFANAVVLITGGASGIGRELGLGLGQSGAFVLVTDLSAEGAERTANEIRERGGRAEAAALDVTDRQAFFAIVDRLIVAQGRIDYLFNNAGIAVGGEARDFEPQDWRAVIDVNLYGVIHGVEAAYPRMLKQGAGHIVNVASIAGLFPVPGEISYTTSKYAVVGLSHALRAEAADLGVRVSVVCPGPIATPIYTSSKLIGFELEGIMSLWPKKISARRCAEQILRGVARDRATIIVTGSAKGLALLARLAPRMTLFFSRRYMRRARAFRVEEPRTQEPGVSD